MCNFPNAYVDETPKEVGETLNASTYTFNSDGTVLTTTVLLRGYNQATGLWKTFGSTIPEPNTGWAGMPIIIFTTDFIGTWTLNFSATDKNGDSCGAGPFVLTINPTNTAMTLQSDKISITSGDSVSFYGTYLPNSNINIFIEGTIRTHLKQVTSNSSGNFSTDIVLTSDTQKTVQIGACSAGGLYIYECSILPDKSNYLYINIYPQLQNCSSMSNNTIIVSKSSINKGESINIKVKLENTITKSCNIYNNDSTIPYGDTLLTQTPFTLDSSGCGETNITFNTAGMYNIYASTDYAITTSTNIIQISVLQDGLPVNCPEPQLYVNGKQGLVEVASTPTTIEIAHCGQPLDDYVITRIDLTPDIDITSGTTNSDGIAKFNYSLPIDGIYEFQSGEDCVIGGVITICGKLGNKVTVRAGNVPLPSSGLCRLIGLTDQQCTYVKYGALALVGLYIIKIVSDAIPKSKK